MTARSAPQPPEHLSRRSRAFWRRVVGEFDLEAAHLELLRRCCEAMDRVDQARETLDREGLTVQDRWGQVKPHPAAALEIQNRTAVRQLLETLKLGQDSGASEAAISLARHRWKGTG